jgi:hypothetical protein
MLTIKSMDTKEPYSQLIDALGGTTQVAEICRVSSQAVSKWRRDGIPESRLMYLQVIRPDVDWSIIRNSQAA